MTLARRMFLRGLVLAPVAPAIVRAASLMPVTPIRPNEYIFMLPPVERYAIEYDSVIVETGYGVAVRSKADPHHFILSKIKYCQEYKSEEFGPLGPEILRNDARHYHKRASSLDGFIPTHCKIGDIISIAP